MVKLISTLGLLALLLALVPAVQAAVPHKPTYVQIAVHNTNVSLAWMGMDSDEYTYNIYRKALPGGSWDKIANTESHGYRDRDVLPGQRYGYRITTYDPSDGGESPKSQRVVGTLPTVTRPTGLHGLAYSDGMIVIGWDTAPVREVTDGYYVWHRGPGDSSLSKIETVAEAVHPDLNLTKMEKGTHIFRVSAYNEHHESSKSKLIRLTVE